MSRTRETVNNWLANASDVAAAGIVEHSLENPSDECFIEVYQVPSTIELEKAKSLLSERVGSALGRLATRCSSNSEAWAQRFAGWRATEMMPSDRKSSTLVTFSRAQEAGS